MDASLIYRRQDRGKSSVLPAFERLDKHVLKKHLMFFHSFLEKNVSKISALGSGVAPQWLGVASAVSTPNASLSVSGTANPPAPPQASEDSHRGQLVRPVPAFSNATKASDDNLTVDEVGWGDRALFVSAG